MANTDLIWKVLEVIFIGLTAGCAVGMFFRSKHVATHDRITKLEDKLTDTSIKQDEKIQDLSLACLRREEFHTVVETLRADNADLRRRVDDILMLLTKFVKKS